MSMVCLALIYAYNHLTAQIKWVMIDSLDEQKIADERAYLLEVAMETNPNLYQMGNVYYNEKATKNTNSRFKNIANHMSAIAEANEAIELSEEEEVGPPIRTVNKTSVNNSKSNIYESKGNIYDGRSGGRSAGRSANSKSRDEDDTL